MSFERLSPQPGADMEEPTGHIIGKLAREIGMYSTLLVILTANIMEGAAKIGSAWVGGAMLDSVIAGDQHLLILLIQQFFIFAVMMVAGIVVKDGYMGRYLEGGLYKLKKRTSEALSNVEQTWLDHQHSGDLSARAANDMNTIAGALRPVLVMGVSQLVLCVLSIGYLTVVNWRMALAVFCLAPITTTLQWLGSRPVRKYRRDSSVAVGKLSSVASDCFGAMETVKSYTMEDNMSAQFSQAQAFQTEAAVLEARLLARLTPIGAFGRFLPQLLLLGVGGLFVIKGSISFGQLTAFIALSGMSVNILGNLIGMMTGIRQVAAAGGRILELWETPQEHPGTSAASVLVENPSDDIVLSMTNIQFTYQGRSQTLSGVSLDLRKGEILALVGESGSGKSTLLKIIGTIYPPSDGEVRFHGRNTNGWELSALRDNIAYVPQEPYMFPDTLYENIACGAVNASYEDVVSAAAAAGLTEFIALLPEGFNTFINERGVTLSGGQRQRVAIARALVKRAELLLLDEALSALDGEMEMEILESLSTLPHRPTILSSAHRLSTIRRAHRIIMLEAGRIVESGSHEELIARGGAYASLVRRQTEAEI